MLHPVSTSAEVRRLDHLTIEGLGLPGPALMELAGRAVAAELLRHRGEEARRGVLVVAGRGNNGGDGYVAARLLHRVGVPVRVRGLGGRRSPDNAATRQVVERLGIPVEEAGGLRDAWGGEPPVVLDALLGTGLSSELRGEVRDLVEEMATLAGVRVAVDLPSGLCGDTGRVLGAAAPAHLTVTFGRARLGALLEPGADLVGHLVVADIGLVGDVPPAAAVPDGAWVAARLPRRHAGDHKGRAGHLAVVAGSPERAGAGVLVAHGALASGVGLVTLCVPRAAAPRLGALRPEVMVRFLDEPAPGDLGFATAVAVGPGVGLGEDRVAMMRRLWCGLPQPAVFDADGLTALVGFDGRPGGPRALTPHPGEAGRLLGWSAARVQADRIGALERLAHRAPTLLKGRHSLVSGQPVLVNRTGGPALATAGSGDVLTGVVGSLLARGLDPREALAAAAFLHGHAADLCGAPPVRAGDVVERLPEAWRSVSRRTDVLDVRPLLDGGPPPPNLEAP